MNTVILLIGASLIILSFVIMEYSTELRLLGFIEPADKLFLLSMKLSTLGFIILLSSYLRIGFKADVLNVVSLY